nr:MAG TPA: hypothetical protein [Caudoviricetes sp.]
MAYSLITLKPSSGPSWVQRLNEVDDGWVAQILNGSFGNNKDYNFTGNVVTTTTDKPIDINIRLTPTVPVPERPVRYFLDLLSSEKDMSVELRDDSIMAPTITYKKNEVNAYTPPTLALNRKVYWKQDCVVREVKYNYSDNPATIEFTLSTKTPVLDGPTFDIYVGLGNQNWRQATDDALFLLNNPSFKIGYVDVETLSIGLPPVGNSSYQIFNGGLTHFKAKMVGNSTTNNGFFTMTRYIDGRRGFKITGGYDDTASLCYSSVAFPMTPLEDVSTFLRTLREPAKFNVAGYGPCYVKMGLRMVRKSL